MKRLLVSLASFMLGSTVTGCDRQAAGGPPDIRFGDTVCDECNMIISDERWATATIIEGTRGPEPRVFDDFNCQVIYESEQQDEAVTGRWSHCHTTREWIETEHALFVASSSIRSPMGSGIAAFRSADEAQQMLSASEGESMNFNRAWKHLGYPAESSAHDSKTENGT